MPVEMTGEQREAIDDVVAFQSKMQAFWQMAKAHEEAVLRAKEATKPKPIPPQDMEEIRRSLARWAGRIRPLFERVVGQLIQPHPFYTGRSNAWDLALVGHELYSQAPFVRLIVDHLDTLIGRLEAEPQLLERVQATPRSTQRPPSISQTITVHANTVHIAQSGTGDATVSASPPVEEIGHLLEDLVKTLGNIDAPSAEREDLVSQAEEIAVEVRKPAPIRTRLLRGWSVVNTWASLEGAWQGWDRVQVIASQLAPLLHQWISALPGGPLA